MKRFNITLSVAALVAMCFAADSAHAFQDKGFKQMRGAGQSMNFRSAGQSLNLRSASVTSQRLSSNVKPQIQKPITGGNLQSLAGLSKSRGQIGQLQQPNLKSKLASGALARTTINPGSIAGKANLSTAISNKMFAKGFLASVHFHPQHCHQPLNAQLWCHYHPMPCHWWWTYCPGLHTCLPTHYCYWDWCYIPLGQVVYSGPVVANSTWYLGVTGMLLPGKGLGIDSVATGSPAASAGLKPGMVISSINGIDLLSQNDMTQAMANSGGVLNMIVVDGEGQAPQAVTVQMVLVANASY